MKRQSTTSKTAIRAAPALGNSAERNLIAGFVLALIILAVIGVTSYRSTLHLVDIAQKVEHSHIIIDGLQDTVRSLKILESALRGYVLTGDALFLKPYRDAEPKIKPAVARLRELLADNPAQQRRWDDIKPLIAAKLAFTRESIALRERNNLSAAAEQQRTGKGEQLMEQIRTLVDVMEADERQLLAIQNAQQQDSVLWTERVIALGCVLAILLLGLSLLVIYRDLAARRRTAAELDRLSALQRAILDSANFTIISTDLDGIIRTFSAGAQRMLGYTEAEVVDKVTPALIHEGSEVVRRAEVLSAELGRTIAPGFEVFVAKARQGRPDENEWTYIRKDGSRYPVLLSVTAMRDAEGNLTGYLGIGQDISARKQAQAERERFFTVSLDMMCTADFNGYYIELNPAWEKVLGYSLDELKAKPFIECVHPEDRERTTAETQRLSQGGVLVDFENRYICKDGSVRCLTWNAVAIQGEQVIYAVARDVTASRQAAQTQAAQKQLLDILHQATARFVASANPAETFNLLLSGMLEVTGSKYGFIGEVLYEDRKPYLRTHAISNIAWNEETQRFYAENAPQGMIFRNLDNLFGQVMATGALVLSNDAAHDPRRGGLPPGHPPLDTFLGVPIYYGGTMVGMFGIANRSGGYDETLVAFLQPFTSTCGVLIDALRSERVRATTLVALQDSEGRVRAVLDNVLEGIVTISPQGSVESFNTAAENIFGYKAAEVIGRNVKMLMPENYSREHDQYLQNYLATGTAKIIGIGREVTGLRKDGTEFPMELAVSEIPLGDSLIFTGIVRDITERKRAEQEIRQFKTTLDYTLDCVFMFDPDSLRFFYVNQGGMDQVGYTFQELTAMTPVYLKPEFDEKGFRALLEPLLSGALPALNFETLHQHKSGKRIPVDIFLQYVAPPGEPGRFVAIVRDITERKHLERMKNEFISTVSHELRTPLTSIRGSLGLIAGGAVGAMPERAKALIDIACNNSDRLVRLINDILDVEKIESGKMTFRTEPVDLVALINEAMAANSAYAAQHSVTYALVEQVADARVDADADRLTQVITNLLSNAAKYSPPNRQVDVAIHRLKTTIRVQVTDYGPGIPEEFQTRIFQKFAQADASDTRQKGGTGLGLSISKAIIERLGGTIGFTTGADGTTFYFDLRPCAATMHNGVTDAPAGMPRQPTILICEDDPDVAQLLGLMLAQGGYASDIAYDAAQAKQRLRERVYVAMTLDIMLPGQNGIALIRELRLDPALRQLPIVVVSAKSDQGRVELNGDALAVVDWLSKPIDTTRLLAAVAVAAQRSGNNRARILYVEDDTDIVRVVSTLLQDRADLICAGSLAAARSSLAQHANEIDLVILDIGLPDGSGLDLLPELHRHDGTPLQVVVFSAHEVSAEISKRVALSLVKSRASNQSLLDAILGLLGKPTSVEK